MIIKNKDIHCTMEEKPRNGKGISFSQKFIDENYFKNKINGFYKNSLQVNSEIGIHKHTDNQEVYFIINGNGQYYENNSWIDVEKGDLLLCNIGETHGLKNTCNTELEFIAFIIR